MSARWLLMQRIKSRRKRYEACDDVVRVTGVEPARLSAREPKSRMSANFIMPAYILLYHISFAAARRKFVAMRACAIYNGAARDI